MAKNWTGAIAEAAARQRATGGSTGPTSVDEAVRVAISERVRWRRATGQERADRYDRVAIADARLIRALDAAAASGTQEEP